jgi:transcriptional regulator with AAA-type ATPase domain
MHLPPLRERAGDIPLLVQHYLQSSRRKTAAPSRDHPDALDVLGAYAWPGNVRELRNVVERMVVLSRGPTA